MRFSKKIIEALVPKIYFFFKFLIPQHRLFFGKSHPISDLQIQIFEILKSYTWAGVYKDGSEIWVARPLLSFLFSFCLARPIRAVQNVLARPLLQKEDLKFAQRSMKDLRNNGNPVLCVRGTKHWFHQNQHENRYKRFPVRLNNIFELLATRGRFPRLVLPSYSLASTGSHGQFCSQ